MDYLGRPREGFFFQLSNSEVKELISRLVSQSVIPTGFTKGTPGAE